jgi:hypothetical protein
MTENDVRIWLWRAGFLVRLALGVVDYSNRHAAPLEARKRKGVTGEYLFELVLSPKTGREHAIWRRNWRASLLHLLFTGDLPWLLRDF